MRLTLVTFRLASTASQGQRNAPLCPKSASSNIRFRWTTRESNPNHQNKKNSKIQTNEISISWGSLKEFTQRFNYFLEKMTTETRFRANSLTSNGSSRPSTPNGSILYDLLTQKETRKTTRLMKIGLFSEKIISRFWSPEYYIDDAATT